MEHAKTNFLLQEEGLLDVDRSTVEDLLPGLIPNGGNITLRHLLSHSSGLCDFASSQDLLATLSPADGDLNRSWEPEELIAVANAHGPTGGRPGFPTPTRTSSCSV
ncbi:MAG TPA: hypothetical protein DIC52_12575 [Candidatus Latescibacteria bacterium]|nr:hypothetical protein [Candidatus Latescibacterota bacterium]